jgi:hypothetical protein
VPGVSPLTPLARVKTGDKILIMTEEMRAKLIEANRERIIALPDYVLPAGESETQTNHNLASPNDLRDQHFPMHWR